MPLHRCLQASLRQIVRTSIFRHEANSDIIKDKLRHIPSTCPVPYHKPILIGYSCLILASCDLLIVTCKQCACDRRASCVDRHLALRILGVALRHNASRVTASVDSFVHRPPFAYSIVVWGVLCTVVEYCLSNCRLANYHRADNWSAVRDWDYSVLFDDTAINSGRLFMLLFALVKAFNIDINAPIFKIGPNGSYFGFSVAEHFNGEQPV
ncbi:unnamed protein product [Toxocara canis]|uniref:Chlorophyll a-b binding protein, chloroplastic n=1 Tax=Toxocara canis TaxID=6265 RepID=A0A183VF55_TOXCA|nr:unnamed protein product [Toxocara canis]